MKVDFTVDNSGAAKFTGYMDGMAEYATKPQFTEAALDYVQTILQNRYELAVDLVARAQPQKFHHMYEWGDVYGDYSTVGVPQMRLWRTQIIGKGKRRSLSYTLLPSVRPVPIEPELLEPGPKGQVVREGVHIFTWKAVVMEYGHTVRIQPKLRQVKSMAFVDDESGKIIFRRTPVITQPGKDQGNAGAFTTLTYTWWNTEAQAIYRNEIAPLIQKKMVPRINGRFAKWNSSYRGRRSAVSNMNVGLSTKDFQQGRKEGLADMKEQAMDYVARAQKRRDDLYGD